MHIYIFFFNFLSFFGNRLSLSLSRVSPQTACRGVAHTVTAVPAVGLHGETPAPAPSPQSNEAATPTPRGASGAEAAARPPDIAPAMLAKLFFFFFDRDAFTRGVLSGLARGERASASAGCTVCSIPWRDARCAGTCRGLEDRFRLLTYLWLTLVSREQCCPSCIIWK